MKKDYRDISIMYIFPVLCHLLCLCLLSKAANKLHSGLACHTDIMRVVSPSKSYIDSSTLGRPHHRFVKCLAILDNRTWGDMSFTVPG